MDNAATLQNMFDRMNAGDVDGFVAAMADDFVEHEALPGGFPPTKDGVRAFFTMYRAAFPDLSMHTEDVVADGDKVVARVRFTGTHRGEFLGMAPTGKSSDVEAIDIVRFGDDGLARDHWGVMDAMGMMQQLGAVPGPPG
jgi:steroid delta-isomerase-like uncharacterized protein